MATFYWVGGTGTWNTPSKWSTTGSTLNEFTASRSGFTLTVSFIGRGGNTIAVGQTIYRADTGVSIGTITARGTGTGGTGTYTMSLSGTITARQFANAENVSTSALPTSADNVVFDDNSGFSSSPTTVTIATNAAIDFTVSGRPAGGLTFAGSATFFIDGNFFLAAGVLWTHSGILTLRGINKTINTNGVAMACAMTLSGYDTYTYTLQNPLTLGVAKALTITSGSLNLAGYALTCGSVVVTGTNTGRTLTLGGAEINLTDTSGTLLNLSGQTASGQFTIVGSPIFNVTNVSATGTRTIRVDGAVSSDFYYGLTNNSFSLNVTGGGGTVIVPSGQGGPFWKNLVFTSNTSCTASISGGTSMTVAGNLEFSNSIGGVTFGTVRYITLGVGSSVSSLKVSSNNIDVMQAKELLSQGSLFTLLSNINVGKFTLNASTSNLNNFEIRTSATLSDAQGVVIGSGGTVAFGTTGLINASGSQPNGYTLIIGAGAILTGSCRIWVGSILASGDSTQSITQKIITGPQPDLDLRLFFFSNTSVFNFDTDYDNVIKSLSLEGSYGPGTVTGSYSIAPPVVVATSTGNMFLMF